MIRLTLIRLSTGGVQAMDEDESEDEDEDSDDDGAFEVVAH